MAWYKFYKNIAYEIWCYVEADSFEEAREEALHSEWEESEHYAENAWVSKAPEDDGDGNVPDPDDDEIDFDEWFSDKHEFYDRRALELPEGESVD